MRRTTLRLFRAHAEAYFRDRFILLSALSGFGGGGGTADAGEAADDAPQEASSDATPQAAPRRRRATRLPSWYELPPNCENPRILGMEDDISRWRSVEAATKSIYEDQRQLEREYRVRSR